MFTNARLAGLTADQVGFVNWYARNFPRAYSQFLDRYGPPPANAGLGEGLNIGTDTLFQHTYSGSPSSSSSSGSTPWYQALLGFAQGAVNVYGQYMQTHDTRQPVTPLPGTVPVVPAQSAPMAMPGWLLPVGLGVVGLVVVTSMMGGRR